MPTNLRESAARSEKLSEVRLLVFYHLPRTKPQQIYNLSKPAFNSEPKSASERQPEGGGTNVRSLWSVSASGSVYAHLADKLLG
jgi:hypothetical protein